MSKTLVILILVIIALSWNFIFKESEKVDFTDSAKVLQGLSQVINYKTAVRKYWEENKKLPTAEEWTELPGKPAIDLSKSLVKSIAVSAEGPGVITMTFINKETINVASNINDQTVSFKPVIQDQRIKWLCSGTLDKQLLPKKCQ